MVGIPVQSKTSKGKHEAPLKKETTMDAKQVATSIERVCWAVANEPREFIKKVYGLDDSAIHMGYINEKITASNGNFVGWWGSLGYGQREQAVLEADKKYN